MPPDSLRIGWALGAVVILLLVVGSVVLLITSGYGPFSPPDSVLESAAAATHEPNEAEPWTGVAWEAPIVEPFGQADPLLRLSGLIDGGDRYIAWGRAPTPGRNQFNDMGSVFVSGDGMEWQTVLIDHGVNAASTSEIYGVVRGTDGLLAYGGVCCAGEAAAIWHSRDGLVWERHELEGDIHAAGIYLQRVVALGDEWLALGQQRNGSMSHIWLSEDGRRWRSVLQVEGGRHYVGLSDLTTVPGAALAAGTVVAPDGSYDGAVWWSADGREWRQVAAEDPALAGDGEVQLHRIVSLGNGLVAEGVAGTADERKRCEDLLGMTAALTSLPPPASAGIALSCGIGSIRHWVSADGSAWRPLEQAPGGAMPLGFEPSDDSDGGLLLLAESSAPESPDTTLFTMVDGLRWRTLDPAPPMRLDSAVGLVVRGDRLLAITEQWGEEGTAWRVWRADLN